MNILYFVLAALALGVLVFFHELGHYFVAKWTGMKVEVFSIGFGRPLLKWRLSDVDWQLGWLPFGGYVKIKGMEFGKKEKDLYQEPYEIPDGFFTKSPWKRMAVAVAGPLANFLLALLFFAIIWSIGGREKPFSDFTQIVGWVDPKSEIYALGLRPGDIISTYDGKTFHGPKSLLYAAMLGGKDVTLAGYHVDYTTGDKRPFTYTVETYPMISSLNGIKTTGVSEVARYLITENTSLAGTPMANSGIAHGDRLMWIDGEVLFSMDQLSHILNSKKTLLTVKRGDQIFLSRQPRTPASDLILPSYVQNELTDWQYEVDVKGRWQDMQILPYVINSERYIEAPLPFIDQESHLQAFPLHPYSTSLEKPLEPGDRIIAVDGTPVEKGYEVLKKIQTHQVQLIVKRKVPVEKRILWKDSDKIFEQSIDYQQIQDLSRQVGLPQPNKHLGSLLLLNPVKPLQMDQFPLPPEEKTKYEERVAKQQAAIESIGDQEKRMQAMQYFEQSQKKLMLGLYLQDRVVNYNPNPFAMFKDVFMETGQTLKALVFGYLNPKFLSGPIGIVQVIHHGWELGTSEALFWIAAISVNLGFLNLLPIPVLDGGYICLSLWEAITRRRLKAKTMERLIIPFVVLLIGLLVFLTFQDLSRLFIN